MNTKELLSKIESMKPQDIRLLCGELSAQEMRTAKALLNWFAVELKACSVEEDQSLTDKSLDEEIEKKLEALAKLEKKSKASILKRVLQGYGGCVHNRHDDRFPEFTEAELRVLRKMKWL